MRMYVIFVAAIIAIAGLFFLIDRGLKAVERGRRRREAAIRLATAARKGAEEKKARRAYDEMGTALTAVLPAIPSEDADRGPRRVALFPGGRRGTRDDPRI
jgi:hypothetical protein